MPALVPSAGEPPSWQARLTVPPSGDEEGGVGARVLESFPQEVSDVAANALSKIALGTMKNRMFRFICSGFSATSRP